MLGFCRGLSAKKVSWNLCIFFPAEIYTIIKELFNRCVGVGHLEEACSATQMNGGFG